MRVNASRWILPVLLLLMAGLAASCGEGEPSPATPSPGEIFTPSPAETPTREAIYATPPGASEMAVDAIPGDAIDAARTVTGTAPFDVNIVIVKADPAYQGYQYMLIWDPEVLALDEQASLEPEGLALCATPATTGNRVSAGCIRTAGPTTFTGPVNSVTLHCIADGTSQLHLLTGEEEGSFTTTLLPDGRVINTALTDASVTCEGVGASGE